MKKIKEFINRHKVISWIVGIFIGIVLIDSIINNDFDNLLNMLYSLFMMSIYLFILYLMTSRKSYLCPKCKGKIKKGDSFCQHCGEKIGSSSTNKPISTRIFLKSKLFYMIGEAFVFIPIAMGFLYLLFAPIVFATNGNSMTAGNTLFVFYTSPNLLPFTITFTLLGIIFILIGLHYRKKEDNM